MHTPFLHLVAQNIQSRFGKDITDIAIVFNNKRPITYLKKYLAQVYAQSIWSPEFYTIQDFFALSSDKTIASPLSQFFHLHQIHNVMLQEEGLEPEAPEEFYPIAEIILRDFDQLDYELVDIDQIYLDLAEEQQIDLQFAHLTAQQQAFIKQFWQSFSAQGHTAVQERFLRLWRRLPTLHKRFNQRLVEENQTRFPSVYRELAEAPQLSAVFTQKFKQVLFIGFNALNQAEQQVFKRWQEEEFALFYFDLDRYYLDDPIQEAGFFLRKNLDAVGLKNALGDPPAVLGHRKTPVHLNQCLGKNAETKLLHDQLLESHKQNPECSTAILLADESLLVPLLQSLPDIQVNITTGYPLVQSSVYGLIDLWMDIQLLITQQKRTQIPFQLVDTFLGHPLVQIGADQKNDLQKWTADKQLFEIAVSDIDISTANLRHFFDPLPASGLFIPTLVALIDDLLTHLIQQEHQYRIETHLLVEVKKTLNQLISHTEQISTWNLSFQVGLVKKALLPISAAIEGDQLSGVQIMGLLESRCLNFDRIFILGANEGILPQTSHAPTFIPTNLRRAYHLPVLENQDALSAYLFYRHFQYSKEIHIFYNGLIDESSTGEESRFIKQLEFESQFQFVHRFHQQPLVFPATVPEVTIEKTGAVWQNMYKKFIKEKKSISASALTTYLYSPLQFFFKYVAEIKEPPAVTQEFEMNRLGTILHNAMERLLTPYKGSEDFIPTAALQSAIDQVDQVVFQEICVQYQLDYQQIDQLSSLHRIMHKIASRYSRVYLEYDQTHYQAFRIVELENTDDYFLDFEIDINGKPEHIKLYGIIDRIDEVLTAEGEVKQRIVDYKTGADSVTFPSLDKVFAMSTANKALIQTLFYCHVYEQVRGLNGLEPHLYVARRMRTEGTLFTNNNTRKTLTLEGSVLAEQKTAFQSFLKSVLEELFNPKIPFRHLPETAVYPSDPYTLFYSHPATDTESDEH